MERSVEDFQEALLVQRVAERFAMEHPTPEARRDHLHEHPNADPKNHTVQSDKPDSKGSGKAHDAGMNWLKTKGTRKVRSLVDGMAGAAKKDGAKQFGMRDVKEALEDWFEGGQAYENSKQKAALKFLATPEGKKIISGITTGVGDAMKDHGSVGFKDIAKVIGVYF